jgi:hypothetical protein
MTVTEAGIQIACSDSQNRKALRLMQLNREPGSNAMEEINPERQKHK